MFVILSQVVSVVPVHREDQVQLARRDLLGHPGDPRDLLELQELLEPREQRAPLV